MRLLKDARLPDSVSARLRAVSIVTVQAALTFLQRLPAGELPEKDVQEAMAVLRAVVGLDNQISSEIPDFAGRFQAGLLPPDEQPARDFRGSDNQQEKHDDRTNQSA